MWISTIIFLLLLPIFWGKRDSIATPKVSSKVWHWMGWLIRAMTAILIVKDPLWLAVYTMYSWIVFELSINHYSTRDWFFIGTTSEWDKFLQKIKVGGFFIFAIKLELMIIFLTIKLI